MYGACMCVRVIVAGNRCVARMCIVVVAGACWAVGASGRAMRAREREMGGGLVRTLRPPVLSYTYGWPIFAYRRCFIVFDGAVAGRTLR